MNRALKQKEQLVISGIQKYTKEHGFPPTIRELKQILGYRSTATVHHYVKKLSEEGVIQYEPSKPRTMVVIDFEGITSPT